jgi:hypothetical protein
MTDRERIFCQKLSKGQTQRAAYQFAYPKAKTRSADTLAGKLLKKPEVVAYLAELRAGGQADALADRDDWLAELRRLGQEAEAAEEYGHAVRAMTELGKAYGHYEPQKIAITGVDAALAKLMGLRAD